MYLRKEKGRFWKWAGIFFALMLIFTLLSRAVYQSGIAVVTIAEPSSGTIDHNVNLSGKTIQNQELAVTTVGNLRIASVQVNEGQQVKKGDVLFTLDLDYLAETILHQQQEMEKQKLSIQDAWSQSNASARQRNNAQAQAAENYDSAVTRAQVTLDRAKRDLDRAKAALEAFYSGVSADQAEENLLVAACEDTKADYDAAVLVQENLAQEINRAVQESIDQAELGDKVTIRAGNTGKLYKDLPVTTFSTTEEVGGGYRITVQLPTGSLSLGASAQLLFTKKSQPYPTCVPLSALRLDARNQPYVLVIEEVNTVLGPQLQAKKVSVTVLDQNETMVALGEGVVSPQDQIIIGSDKAVEPGTRIRVG